MRFVSNIIFLVILFVALGYGINSQDQKNTISVPEKNFLTYGWAIYTNKNPGKAKNASKEEAIQKSKALNEKGLALKKKKKYAEAVKAYEEAIEYFAYAELYYNYANALTDIPKLQESIEAYKIADKLGYVRPELILYNIACSYSRLNEVDKAYQYLALAVDRGYSAFKYIQKDPDMANLRKRDEWEEKITSLVPKSVKFSKKDFIGELSVPTPRIPIEYFLCSSGIVIEYAICEKGYFKGKWNYKDGDIKVTWEKDCREVPDGKLIMAAGACEQYDKYKFEGCRKPDDDLKEQTMIISKSEVVYMKGILKPGPYDEFIPSHKPSKKEPKACDPNYSPKTSSDLDL